MELNISKQDIIKELYVYKMDFRGAGDSGCSWPISIGSLKLAVTSKCSCLTGSRGRYHRRDS